MNLTIYRTLYVHKDSVTAPYTYRCWKQPPNSGLKYRKLPQFDDHLRRQNIHICLWAAQRVNPSCHDTAAKSFRHFARFLGLQEVNMRTAGKNAPCLVLQAPQPSNIFSAACPLSALAVGCRPTCYQLCFRLYILEFNTLMYRLNMELDLQSLFGLHVYSCTHWLRPRNPAPSSAFGLIRGRYWSAKIDDVSS